MRFKIRDAALLAAGLALGGLAMAASAQTRVATSGAVTTGDGTLLSVSVQAETTRAPDIARMTAGVTTQAANADAAMQANAERMSQVIAAVRKAGIAERDIQTSGVNLHPQYDYREGQAPAITGYQATNTIAITVRDIAELGGIMDALVAAGANQINGPSFDVENKQAAFDEARRAALEKARNRAQMYAKTLDMRVRRIASISEGNSFNPPMPMMAMARMEKADASTPIVPGESTLSVSLDVVFELGR